MYVEFLDQDFIEIVVTVVPRLEARRARGAASCSPSDHPRLHGQQALALQLLARELAGTADGLRLLSEGFS